MAFERRQYSGNAIPTTVVGTLDASVTSIPIAASTGWPDGSVGPSFVTIDQGTASEERVKSSSRSGGTLTVARGADGTAAVSHAANAPITHSHSKTDLDEANQHYADTTLDHHSQYARTDGTRAITGKQTFTVAAAGTALNARRAADTAGSGFSVSPFSAAGVNLASGAENDGTTSTARATTAAQLAFLNGVVRIFGDTGLTPGSTYSRTLRLTLDPLANLLLGNGVSTPTTGVGFGLSNIGTALVDTPTGGGWLYAENGALKWKGSGGTITTVAAA